MWIGVIENFHLSADRLAVLETLEARIMGETGVNSYSLQPLAHYGRLFTLEARDDGPDGPRRESGTKAAAGLFEIVSTLPPDIAAGEVFCAGEILGAAEFIRSFDNCGLAHLFGFYIVETLWGSGAASSFLCACERRLAAAYSVGSIDLTVSGDNARAVAFYRKNGYAVIGEADDYYGRGRGRLIMGKDL